MTITATEQTNAGATTDGAVWTFNDAGTAGLLVMPDSTTLDDDNQTQATLHHQGWRTASMDVFWFCIDRNAYWLLERFTGHCGCAEWSPCGGVVVAD